jgi:hypothetical protein
MAVGCGNTLYSRADLKTGEDAVEEMHFVVGDIHESAFAYVSASCKAPRNFETPTVHNNGYSTVVHGVSQSL